MKLSELFSSTQTALEGGTFQTFYKSLTGDLGVKGQEAIRIILMLNKEMQGHLKLSNANKAVLEVFKLSGLLNVLSFE